MSEKEAEEVLKLTSSLKKHTGTILGILDGKYVCVPEESRLNKKYRCVWRRRVNEDPSTVSTAFFRLPNRGNHWLSAIRNLNYTKPPANICGNKNILSAFFYLVSPEHSDSWACLSEIKGDELMTQLFCDVIIKNTGDERGDHFWDSAEMNLLKALVLYVEQGSPCNERSRKKPEWRHFVSIRSNGRSVGARKFRDYRPHDFRVPERPVNNGNKREMSYLSIERLSFSCNPVCVRSSASGENTLFNFFFVFWRWVFYNPAKASLPPARSPPKGAGVLSPALLITGL